MRLVGTKINLRPVTKHDAQSIYQYARDKEISRYTFIPYPYKLEDALHFIRHTQIAARKGTEFNLGIESKVTGQIIGMIGLMYVSKKHQRAEIGYWVAKSFWGKGHATEAIRLMLRYAFDQLGLVRIVAGVLHPNAASARVLEKVGFLLEGCLRRHVLQHGQWLSEFRYGILKEEFDSSRS